MRIDSSGNLGLGVTPSAWNSDYRGFNYGSAGLIYGRVSTQEVAFGTNWYRNSGGSFLYTANGNASYYAQASGLHAWYTAASGTAGNAITFTQAMTLDASGNLGIGTTSPTATLQVAGTVKISNSNANNELTFTGTDFTNVFSETSSGFQFGTTSTGYLAFLTNNTERARIDSSGNLLVGTTNAYGRFYVFSTSNSAATAYIETNAVSYSGNNIYSVLTGTGNNNTTARLYSGYNNTNGDVFYVYGNGNVVNYNNSYGAISDIKLKENIVDASPKLADLMQVKVRNYNIIGDTTKQLGVVAQELETVFPSMIDESPDRDVRGNDLGTTTKQVKYSVFVPMLIKAIQELKAEFDAYKASHP
jgi:hypothetical protein